MWWGMIVCGWWSFMVGDHHLWTGVVVHGWVLSFMDGGWSFVGGHHRKGVVVCGHLGV